MFAGRPFHLRWPSVALKVSGPHPYFRRVFLLPSDDIQTDHKEIDTDRGIWFVYDGDCPLCRSAAKALKIQESVGPLHLLDAREAAGHPLMAEIRAAQLDLDEGMVIKYSGQLYHGAAALMLMALLGSDYGWFNKVNAALFKSKACARICYPVLRGGRNLLLKILGVQKINAP